jgi:uncharacterized protein YdaU (DUF1376 family)
MPFYVADYLADTGHLSTVEHGAYLLLIMHYWQSGGLPADDKKLARITRLSPREWAAVKDTIAGFFDANWRHSRIDHEVANAEDKISKRSAAGKAGAAARHGNRTGNRTTNASQPQPQPQTPSTVSKETSEGRSRASPVDLSDPNTRLYHRGREVLGKAAGGQITKLLAALDGSVPKATAAVETASTKVSPGEYIAAIIRGRRTEEDEAAIRERNIASGLSL